MEMNNFDLNKNITVCFTGSRPNKMYGYKALAYQKLVDQLVEYIVCLYHQGYRNFITGGAQGFDQCVFWAIHKAKNIHKLDLKNILCSPLDHQDKMWLKQGVFSQEDYQKMCNCADDIIWLHHNELMTEYRDVARALNERNEVMCDLSNLLIGFWDKEIDPKSIQKSGTANCLKYGQKIKLAIGYVNPTDYSLYLPEPDSLIQPIEAPPMLFKGYYDFCSNMYPCLIKYKGMDFNCTEVAYHYHRIDPSFTIVRNTFRLCKDGYAAKKLTNSYKKSGQLKLFIRNDWEQINLQLMYELVFAKFSQNPELKQRLLATNDTELIENNVWKDTFWGKCNGIGENHLGKILMQVRKELS